jgi:cytochrome c
MAKDPLLINKIAAGVLTAGLLGMGSAELSSALYGVEELEQNAFVIAEPEDGAQTAALEVDPVPAGPADILPLLAAANPGDGERQAKKCAACHSFEEGGANKVGPTLWDIVNLDKGSHDFGYSDVMANFDGEWTYEALNGFLYAPADYMPGTKMKFRGVKNDGDRADLIAYLRSLSANPAPLP